MKNFLDCSADAERRHSTSHLYFLVSLEENKAGPSTVCRFLVPMLNVIFQYQDLTRN